MKTGRGATERPAPVVPVPWQGKELPHMWAMVRAAKWDKHDFVMQVINTFGTDLRGLSRRDWMSLLHALESLTTAERREALRPKDPPHGRTNDGQWEKILVLQKALGWNDEHRDNYIRKHGHIDSVRFMTVPIGRAIITGMEKILTWKEGKELNHGNRGK